jgi:hypothetical protein
MTKEIEYSEAFTEHIYLVLADYSWSIFPQSKFSTYVGWCDYIRKNLDVGKVEPVKYYIYAIAQNSSRFFGFPEDELTRLTMEFFLFRKYEEYYEHIRLCKLLHGGYIIKKKIKI